MAIESTLTQDPATNDDVVDQEEELTPEQIEAKNKEAFENLLATEADAQFKVDFYESKIKAFQKIAETFKKKTINDFNDEAQELAKISSTWQNAHQQIETLEAQLEQLKEVRKNEFQGILNKLFETYQAANKNTDEENEAAYNKAKSAFDSAKNLMKDDPIIYNYLMKKYNIRTREVAPRTQSGSGNGEIGNISGFIFEMGGNTFTNTGSLLKHTGGQREDFIKAFVEAQGTTNRKEWKLLADGFTFQGKTIVAKPKTK